MQPLAALAPALASGLRGIFCDIDDTLTHEGVLVPAAYAALVRAKAAGLRVVPVTGRPAGWAAVHPRPLAPSTPRSARTARSTFYARAARLLGLPERGARPVSLAPRTRSPADILTHVPRARLANDQWLRLCDLAFRHRRVPDARPRRGRRHLCAIEAGRRARSTISTVHAHAIPRRLGQSPDGPPRRARSIRRRARRHPLRTTCSSATRPGTTQGRVRLLPVAAGVSNVTRYLDRLQPPPGLRGHPPPAATACAEIHGSDPRVSRPPIGRQLARRRDSASETAL